MNATIAQLQRDRIVKMLASGKRLDGRGLEEPRPLTIEKGVAKQAEGSARVRLGRTDVLVGAKISLGEPFPDTPNSGVLTTSAELPPMASPEFETGPPSPEAVEIARVVDRGIRESKAVDMGKLCIVPGEKVWVLYVDIHALDYDGNLFDAASYGAMAALTSATLPASKVGQDDRPLPVETVPVSVTCAKIGDALLVDPCLDEERVADARLTVTTDERGHVRAMQKGLRGSFSFDEVKRVVRLSAAIGKEIRETILK
jgi:exosome complex component RRP42